MKKMLLLIVFVMFFTLFISCTKENEKEEFTSLVNEETVYTATGIMESFYPNGRKQNDFEVLYKSKENIKVVLSNANSDGNSKEKQIILKNKDGVYVLIPSINKNFKIQSSWPTSASYPYLLYSLVKDIKDNENNVVVDNENYLTYETKTHVFKNDKEYKEKIIVDKNTNLPEEVLIYDDEDNLFIRVVFENIVIGKSIDDKEFVVDDTMSTIKEEYGEDFTFENRVVRYPTIYPDGMKLIKESTVSSEDGEEVLSIMKFSSDSQSFTLIEEYVNMNENTTYQQEDGNVINILGNVGILKANSVITVYNGIEYTIASNDLDYLEMIEVLSSFMHEEEK